MTLSGRNAVRPAGVTVSNSRLASGFRVVFRSREGATCSPPVGTGDGVLPFSVQEDTEANCSADGCHFPSTH